MRFKISLELLGDEPRLLPPNYQPELSAWIYKTLHFGNEPFKKWLSEKGYLNAAREYQLFTFSNLKLTDFGHHEDRLLIKQTQTSFCISFVAGEDIGPFIVELFRNQEPRIGDKKSKVQFRVASVERIPDPTFTDEMNLSCISPLVLTRSSGKKAEFLSPDEKDFGVLFFKNLMAKYATMVKQLPNANNSGLSGLSDLQFRLLDKPKSRVVKINPGTPSQESIKGYLFDFSLKAPAELIRLGYFAGFGEQGYHGFGCCKLKK
jgi:CRISPR-associated endoribonuclease Cas6